MQAFSKFVKETKTNLTALLANTSALTSVLTYHVHGNQAYSTFPPGNITLTMLNGQKLTVVK